LKEVIEEVMVKEMRQVLASCSGLCTTDLHFLQECKDPHLRLRVNKTKGEVFMIQQCSPITAIPSKLAAASRVGGVLASPISWV